MKAKKICCLLLMLTFVTSFIVGCGGASQKTAGGKNSIVVGLQAEPTTLDPAQMSDYNSTRAGMEMFNNLVEFKDGSTELQPGLAKSWEISPDGLSYTFHLRTGIKFHDGTPFNADAVKFNVERQIDKNNPYNSYGTFGYADFTFGMVKDLQVVDQNTIKFNLKYKFAPFLSNMAIPAAAMVSPTAIKKYKKDISQHPVGTGPFKFVKWEPGVNIVVEKNSDYWRGAPKLDKIYYRPITDDAARVTELESGKIDFMVGVLPDDLKRLEQDKSMQVQKQAGMHTWYLVFNCTKPPFNNVKVRQAFNYAINKKSIVDNILKGTGTLAKNLLPPVIWSYTDDVQTYDYNPAKAKELLKEAGVGNLTLDFYVPQSGSGMQQPVTMATAIQSDLQAVGVKVNIKQIEWGSYLDKVEQPVDKNEVLFHEMSWIGDNGDPDNFLYILTSGEQWPKNGYNQGFYKNPELDTILNQARQTTDKAERTRLYQQAQKIVAQDSPQVVVDHETQIVVMKKNIRGFKLHPTGIFRFDKVSVE